MRVLCFCVSLNDWQIVEMKHGLSMIQSTIERRSNYDLRKLQYYFKLLLLCGYKDELQ